MTAMVGAARSSRAGWRTRQPRCDLVGTSTASPEQWPCQRIGGSPGADHPAVRALPTVSYVSWVPVLLPTTPADRSKSSVRCRRLGHCPVPSCQSGRRGAHLRRVVPIDTALPHRACHRQVLHVGLDSSKVLRASGSPSRAHDPGGPCRWLCGGRRGRGQAIIVAY